MVYSCLSKFTDNGTTVRRVSLLHLHLHVTFDRRYTLATTSHTPRVALAHFGTDSRDRYNRPNPYDQRDPAPGGYGAPPRQQQNYGQPPNPYAGGNDGYNQRYGQGYNQNHSLDGGYAGTLNSPVYDIGAVLT
jgi:hypothetical protein